MAADPGKAWTPEELVDLAAKESALDIVLAK
jgi:hypothetical protein